ncbi:TPA: hypothetical protein L0X66_000132 [Citrobacter freundii]|nr:hypothetical protein [Citrobacter freundii]
MTPDKNCVLTCTKDKNDKFVKLRELNYDFDRFLENYAETPHEYIEEDRFDSHVSYDDLAAYRTNELIFIYINKPLEKGKLNKEGYYYYNTLSRQEVA